MRRVRSALLLPALLAAAAAPAQVTGPPAPPPPARTAAEQAIAGAQPADGARRPGRPCRQGRGDDITVCGTADGRSPYRLPLPDERTGQRFAGEAPGAAIGDGPVPTLRGGVTVARFGMGREAKARAATLKLIDEQKQAEAERAERERAAGGAAATVEDAPAPIVTAAPLAAGAPQG